MIKILFLYSYSNKSNFHYANFLNKCFHTYLHPYRPTISLRSTFQAATNPFASAINFGARLAGQFDVVVHFLFHL